MTRKKACDSCHAKKIQCDGAKPRCDWCAHHDLSCTYERVAPPRKQRASKVVPSSSSQHTGQPEGIEERIARLEELFRSQQQELPVLDTGYSLEPRAPSEPCSDRLSVIEAWVNSHHYQPPEMTSAAGGVFYGRLYFAGYDLGDISSNSGIPIFSEDGLQWIRERTGEHRPFALLERHIRRHWSEQMHASYAPSALPRVSSSPAASNSSASPPATRPPEAPRDPRTQMPSRAIAERYWVIFLNSPLRLIFPMVDEILFRNTIEIAYEYGYDNIQPPIEVIGARASVLAFMAILTLLESDQTAAAAPINADHCAAVAQDWLLAAVTHPSVDGLRAAYMLLQSASMALSLACRCVFMLGGHLKPQESMDTDMDMEGVDMQRLAQKQIRHIFWLCYFFDKHISLRTGQPPAIDDNQCDLTLPSGYLGINRVGHGSVDGAPPDVRATEPVLPSDLNLMIIKSKVFTMLYSANALKKSDAHLLRDIRELDEELDRWAMSVEPSVRPSMYRSTQPTDKIVQRDIGMVAIFCHFEYHYLVATIHQASGRCRAWAEDEHHATPEAVQMSLDFSVQASRSSLLHLKAAHHGVHKEAFWLVVFFPMWACVIIFCNVLYNPTDDRARDDVELLDSIPALVKGMCVQQPTRNEVVHLKMVDAFIAELVRLANCAIEDANAMQS